MSSPLQPMKVINNSLIFLPMFIKAFKENNECIFLFNKGKRIQNIIEKYGQY